jgi:hypothetical protein
MQIQTVIAKLNVPLLLATWALGEKHHPVVRLVAGAAIMTVGVLLAKLPVLCGWHHFALHCTTDLVGFGIHAVGVTPFLEILIHKASEEQI